MHFGIFSETGPGLAFDETKSNIVMNNSRSKSRPNETKLKHCMPQILSVLALSVKYEHFLCSNKK